MRGLLRYATVQAMQAETATNTPSPIRAWVWLFPATYLLHLGEEYWAGEGFPAWLSRVAGAQLSERDFLTLNAIALVLMSVGVFLIQKHSWRWLLVGLSGTLVINSLLHLFGSILTRSYSPGLISGLLCWLPLGVIILRQQWQQTSRQSFGIGIAVAVGLHAIVSLLALLA